MTYSEKLRDPRWQRKRLEILQRDNWACLECQSKNKPLQVHHIIYGKREPWDYPDYLYQTLCDECHKERHLIIDKIVAAIRIAIKNIPTGRLVEIAQKLCREATMEIEVEK
jgi:5-methylcytosine-specific restriction endonuclease McrA